MQNHPKTSILNGWLLLGLLILIYTYFLPRWADWNQNSRLDLVLAIVDQHTLAIDEYVKNTGDYAIFKEHYYSDKAPGLSFLGIQLYWVFKHLVANFIPTPIWQKLAANSAFSATLNTEGTGLLTDKIYFFLSLTFVTFFVVAIPSALLGLMLYRLLARFGLQELLSVELTLAFAIATPVFAYANNFYGHQVVAAALFAAFLIAFDLINHSNPLRLFGMGFLLALSIITEYPTVLVVAGIGIYALARIPDWRKWSWIILGGIPPLVLAATYNWMIFGTPLPVGYEHSALWQDVHRIGFFSLTIPSWSALWGITGSPYRGLFFLSPFLLFAFPGFYFWWKRQEYCAEFFLFLWVCVSFLLFNSSSAMWSGGFAVGPRYLVPIIPFLVLPIVYVIRDTRSWWTHGIVSGLIVLSFILVWIETISGQSFPQFQPNPLVEYSIPHFVSGDIARNLGMLLGLRGLSSLVPILVLVFIFCIWIMYSTWQWQLWKIKPQAHLSQ